MVYREKKRKKKGRGRRRKRGLRRIRRRREKKIVLRRRTTPNVITLPNGTTFTTRYQRISRKHLPINIHVKKNRKIGARNSNKSKMGLALLD